MPSNIELHHQRQWTISHLVAQVCIGEDAAVSCFPTPSRERRWPPNIPHICKAKGMQMPTGCGEQKEANRRELYIYIYILYNSCIRFCLLSVFPSSRTPSLCLNFWSYTLENQSMTLPWGPLIDSCGVAWAPWWRATTTKFFTFAAPRTCVVESPAGNGLAWGISCVDMDTKNFQDLNAVGICWLPPSWGWTNVMLQVATSFHHLFAHLWTSHNHHVITPATHRFNKHLLNPHLHQLSSIP